MDTNTIDREEDQVDGETQEVHEVELNEIRLERFDDRTEPGNADLAAIEQDVPKTEEDLHKYEELMSEPGAFYYRVVREHCLLTPQQVIDLYKTIRSGNDISAQNAREKMALHNLRLVICWANKYKSYGMSLDDLIQEGNLGLMKAIEKFKPERGYKFSTYAIWWIRQKIRQALRDQSSQIRLPSHVHDLRNKIKRVANELQQQLGSRPTIDQIAKKVGCLKERVEEAFSGFGKTSFSFNQEVGFGDNGPRSTHGDMFADEKQQSPAVDMNRIDGIQEVIKRLECLLDFLQTIPSRKANIFRKFYGLTEDSCRIFNNLEMVGCEFGLTRERVRQIVKQVWRTIQVRHPDLEINHDILTNLRLDIGLFVEIWGKVNSQYKTVETIKFTGKKANKLMLKAGMKNLISVNRKFQPSHIRASPSFVKWRSISKTLTLFEKVLTFVSRAYEVSQDEILGFAKQNHESVWARRVCGFLMSAVGIDLKATASSFSKVFANDFVLGKNVVEQTMKIDQLVRQDIEGMLAHLRKVLR